MKSLNDISRDNIKFIDADFLNMNDEELESFIINLPDNIQYLSFTTHNMLWRINNLDIPLINKFIELIKKYNKKIKIIGNINDARGNMSNKDFDYSFFYKIDGLDYVEIISLNNDILNGMVIKSRLDTLKLVVKDMVNSKLSPFEKIICCYNITKAFKKYKKVEFGVGKDLARSLYMVLENEYMVCVGYSQMLRFLLNECGIDCVVYDDNDHLHELAYVTIKDDKYGIYGYYKLDPTNDLSTSDKMMYKHYNYFCKDLASCSQKTKLDLFLTNETTDNLGDDFLKYDLPIVIDLLEPELKLDSISTKEKRFKENFEKQKYKEIPQILLFQAIIYIEEHIYEKKLTDIEKLKRVIELFDKINFEGKTFETDQALYDVRKGYVEKTNEQFLNKPKILVSSQAKLYTIDVKNGICSFKAFDENGNLLESYDNIKWETYESSELLFNIFKSFEKTQEEIICIPVGDSAYAGITITDSKGESKIIINGINGKAVFDIYDYFIEYNDKVSKKFFDTLHSKKH